MPKEILAMQLSNCWIISILTKASGSMENFSFSMQSIGLVELEVLIAFTQWEFFASA